MATWQQVKKYVYTKYKVSDDDGDSMTLLFETNGGRSQLVFLRHIEADELSSVLFTSPFAESSKVSADRVLRATEEIPAGIRSLGKYFVVTHSQLLSTVDDAEIDLPMAMVVSNADKLEDLLGKGDAF